MRSRAFSSNLQGRRIRSRLLQVGLLVGIPLNMLIFIPGGIFDFPVRNLFAPILHCHSENGSRNATSCHPKKQ